jgi:hypothetical protein
MAGEISTEFPQVCVVHFELFVSIGFPFVFTKIRGR